MRAVRELVTLGYLAEPEPLHGRAGMRFWFNTGWNDEDEAGYVEWATSGFVVQEGNINVSAYDANEPYCDAFEFGFPTLDSRDRWVQRAKESLARWSHKLFGSRRLKYPIAKVYVLGILEAVVKARQADDYLTHEGRKRYEARLAALAHNGPSRSDVDLVVRKLDRIFGSSSADATTTITSGPSLVPAPGCFSAGRVADFTLPSTTLSTSMGNSVAVIEMVPAEAPSLARSVPPVTVSRCFPPTDDYTASAVSQRRNAIRCSALRSGR